ncbi:porin family protein [Halomonas binhaiensis]|uniref:Porin family protein n=1 Tax=Halomonas binhaiensis TaxID=2562282 RepID=A0A5C1NIB2_9GAMM|nr:porin family protein [Halomonas binhaiensis]QEM81987.1 porin family protein [Halomonas binhaiensis]
MTQQRYVQTLYRLGIAGLAAGTLAAAPTAFAADDESGPYIGAGVGFSSQQNDDDDIDEFIDAGTSDFDVDDEDNVWKVYGGYNFNRYLGVEAFYTDLGTVKIKEHGRANANLDSTAYGANVVGKLPITDWFSPYAKVGAAHWETDVHGNLGNDRTVNKDGTGMVYGVGAEFQLAPVILRTEYERYDLDKRFTVDAFTASVGMRF